MIVVLWVLVYCTEQDSNTMILGRDGIVLC